MMPLVLLKTTASILRHLARVRSTPLAAMPSVSSTTPAVSSSPPQFEVSLRQGASTAGQSPQFAQRSIHPTTGLARAVSAGGGTNPGKFDFS